MLRSDVQARAGRPARREDDADDDGTGGEDDRNDSSHTNLVRREMVLKGFDAERRILRTAQSSAELIAAQYQMSRPSSGCPGELAVDPRDTLVRRAPSLP